MIITNSFQKVSSDFKRQPSSFPGENDSGQESLFIRKVDIKDRLKKKNKVPTETIYQFGLEVPVAKKEETGML